MTNSVFRFLIVGFLVFLIMLIHLFAQFGVSEITLLIVIGYVFLCEFYIFLFTLSLGCVSINLLRLLRQGEKSVTEINSLYRPSYMVSQRFVRLQTVGLIEHFDKIPILTKKGEHLIKTVLIVRNFFHKKN